MSASTNKPIQYVLTTNFLQIVIDNKPFTLDSTHPTFKRLTTALKKKEWTKVPKLVSAAELVEMETGGDVKVLNGKVYYKGREIHNTLTARMLKMLKEGKSIQHLQLFMSNLYKNPNQIAIDEFYDWLVNNSLPICDNGDFLAYKSVNHDNTDTHTGKIDFSPGRIVMMRRKAGDTNWHTQCSAGFHVCSKQYGVYGSKQMCVKVNPRDVLSAQGGKMRVLRLEVLFELGSKNEDLFKAEGYVNLENQSVVKIAKTKEALLKKVLSLAVVKRGIKKRKMSKRKIEKMSFGRLRTFLLKVKPQRKIKPAEIKSGHELAGLRKDSNLSRNEIAKQMGLKLKDIMLLEAKTIPLQSERDSYLEAVLTLKDKNLNSDVSFKKAVA